MTKEAEIEQELITKLASLKYSQRDDIRDRDELERNFRDKFETPLNRVKLTDSEFERLLEMIVTPDVFANAERLRNWNTFEREDGTPLHYQLVNLKDWCRNTFEVVQPAADEYTDQPSSLRCSLAPQRLAAGTDRA
ncbi:type I restriction endonuclease [Gemmobacter nectariphilus]|jgi:type I restriction enzyme R subunit|uniref:type I restriction endonuclease n=1 Tax=Gemmobacter nectariphilus TaxID=220343 RepID=UPI001B7FB01A|nr:type I restriction endonuclease [Gemmobacter nectariphilus]